MHSVDSSINPEEELVTVINFLDAIPNPNRAG
jgi:hypothetical protein